MRCRCGIRPSFKVRTASENEFYFNRLLRNLFPLYICFPACASCVFKLWRAQALEDEAIFHQPSNLSVINVLMYVN